MKFCYVDESGLTNTDSIVVLVGVVVDAQRMHVSKGEWTQFLTQVSERTSVPLQEIHTRELYRGQGPWFRVPGQERAEIIDMYLDWFAKRKHHFTFSAVDAERLKYACKADASWFRGWEELTPGCAAALHMFCGLQKKHQTEEKNKGHTVVVIDGEQVFHQYLCDWACHPPAWTDRFYGRKKHQQQFDQLVDVPYSGDSRKVALLQMSDLLAYVFRLHTELQTGTVEPKYDGEKEKVAAWVDTAMSRAYERSVRWPAKGRSDVENFFYSIAPDVLREL